MEITFTFRFKNEKDKRFFLSIDNSRLSLVQEKKKNLPEWAKLKFHRCLNCSIHKKYCPAAVNILEPAIYFSERNSCDAPGFTMHINGKSINRPATFESALANLYGVLVWSSKCPVFGKLGFLLSAFKPLLNNKEFYDYAILSHTNYFSYKGIKKINSQKFFDLFEQARMSGKYFCKRISEISGCDANRNALIRLDNYYLHVTQLKNRNLF